MARDGGGRGALERRLRSSGHVVLVSGFGSDGRGGVVAVDGGDVGILDSLPTTGLAYESGCLGRLLRAPVDRTSAAEMVLYDERGVVEYRRLDGVVDPHDILADGGGWLVVSTGTTEIVRVEGNDRRRIFAGPEAPDAWHLNCLTRRDGFVWATAFGRFSGADGWRGPQNRGAGVLWNVETGEEVTGLTEPHTPRSVGGDWVVCESFDHVVVRRRRHGTDRCRVGGFARGLVVVEELLLAGVSRGRDTVGEQAEIAIIDLASFEVLDRMPVPFAEIYDLIVVPAVMADAIRTGFGTNTSRASGPGLTALGKFGSVPADRLRLGQLLDPSECGCRIVCTIPHTAHSETEWLLDVEIQNTGTATLASVDPHPVLLASRWVDHDGVVLIDGPRSALPVVLAPGQRAIAKLPVRLPGPGTHNLRVSLVHELHFWFDDLHPSHGVNQPVVLVAPLDKKS